MRLIDLTEKETEIIENRLSEYDEKFIKYPIDGKISIGIKIKDDLVAGLEGCITTFNIFYLSTLFVEEEFRRKGLGKCLIEEMEIRAKKLGANTIRLDTFDFQGKDFYKSMGYEQVGYYRNDEDNFEEYFFLKRI
ncbi:GNAT family N-acetyltransferase [Streptococcus suis]